MTVSEVSVHDIARISTTELHDRVRRGVNAVRGDFRQSDILNAWDEVLAARAGEEFTVIRMSIFCSAGTYVRSLAHVMGRHLGTGGVLLELRRTSVGRWRVDGRDVIRSGQLLEPAVV
jgi:tRNA pseudouridine55 synthase